MNRPRIEIVVDELVVRGLRPAEARLAAAALETRLTALAGGARQAPPAREESFRRLPSVEARSPAGIGEAVAGAVWSGINGGRSRR